MKKPLFVAILLTLGMVSPVQADTERIAFFGGVEVGTGTIGGELGKSFQSDSYRFAYFAGLKLDDFDLRLSIGGGELRSNRPELHGNSLDFFDSGADLRYMTYRINPHTELYVRAGLHKQWWGGNQDVRRYCKETKDCFAGFDTERPNYQGLHTRFGVGAEFTPLAISTRFFLTLSADVGYETINMDIFPGHEHGHLFTANLHVAIGGGSNDRR